jgi:hypothetical protein
MKMGVASSAMRIMMAGVWSERFISDDSGSIRDANVFPNRCTGDICLPCPDELFVVHYRRTACFFYVFYDADGCTE